MAPVPEILPFDPRPLTLEGRDVILTPLEPRHRDDLYDAGRDHEIWSYLPWKPFESPDDADKWITAAIHEQSQGCRIPFVIVDRVSGAGIGSTSYLSIERKNRTIEIGWTWLAVRFHRTYVNTQCKLVLLEHAFDELGAVRVQFKTDARNVRSQKAIDRLGAVREGTLRQTMIMPSGRHRDSVYYSIIDSEWPAVRQRLRTLTLS